MPPSLTLIVTLTSLLLLPVASGDVRRVLHEPLLPIEWTPPPSPPAPPAPDFASDPSTPAPPDNGGPALLPPSATPALPPPNTVAADVSSSRSGPTPRLRGGGGTPKAAIVVASAAAAAVLALLAFAAAFFLTGRLARHPAHPQKPPAPAHHGSTTLAGLTDAAGRAAVAGSSMVSPYHKVRAERARRGMCRDVDIVPSPELRPLPPLRLGASAAPGSSDEDAAYYTPGQRSAGSSGGEGGGTWSEASASSPRTTTPSRRSLPSLTSDFFPTTPAAASPVAVAPLLPLPHLACQ